MFVQLNCVIVDSDTANRQEMATFLSQLYNREVSSDDTVTVIRFSQIVSRP